MINTHFDCRQHWQWPTARAFLSASCSRRVRLSSASIRSGAFWTPLTFAARYQFKPRRIDCRSKQNCPRNVHRVTGTRRATFALITREPMPSHSTRLGGERKIYESVPSASTKSVKARSWARLSSANVTLLFLPPFFFPLTCSVPLNSVPWTGAYSTFHEFSREGTR